MRKLKSSVKTAVVSTVALTSTAAIIYAIPNLNINEVKSSDIGNKLKLDVEKIDSDTVKVSIDNVQDIPKSIQFSVKLDGNVELANGQSSIKDLIKPQVQTRLANNEYQENSNEILTDYTYNQESNTIDVLITAENSLPKFGNKIEVFELDIKASEKTTKQGGTTYKVVPNNEDEYKYLSITNKEYNDLGVAYDDEAISLNTAPTLTTSKEFIKVVEGETLELTPESLGITMEDKDNDVIKLEVKDLSQSNKPIITTFKKDTPGLYNLECRAVDSTGEKSEPITLQVYVDYDAVKELPTITRDGEALEANITIHGGEVFKPLENVKAVDAKGRELEVKVTTNKELNLDPENDTTYVLTYTAVDTYGNEAKIEVNLKVIANKAPVISGVKNHTIKIGDSFDPRKDVVVSDEDNDIELVVDSNVNTSIAGEYKVSYSATDSKGKTTRVQSTVKVNPKTASINIMPIVIVNDTTINQGDEFNPLNIIKVYNTNNEDITSTVDIKVSGDNVDTNKDGIYNVTYVVTDKNGVKVTKKITVTVVKKVILASEIKISNKFNSLYVGATKEISASVNKDADNQNIQWSVSNSNILDIKVEGNTAKITAKGEGKAVVTVTTTDGTNLSDSFEITVQDFNNKDIIPDTIMNIIDTNIVIPVSGDGNEKSPVELEVKDVKEYEFEQFIKNLKKSNSKIVDIREEDKFTVYKIKLSKFRLFARTSEYYVEVKIDNNLTNASKYKEIIANTLKEDISNGNEGNISGGNTSTDNNESTSGSTGSESTDNDVSKPEVNDSTNNSGNTSNGNTSTNNGVTNNNSNSSTGNTNTNTNKVENESSTTNEQLEETTTVDNTTNEIVEESTNKLEESTTNNPQGETTEESKDSNNIIAYIGVGIAAIAGVLFAKGKKDE